MVQLWAKLNQRFEVRFMLREGRSQKQILEALQRMHGANALSQSSVQRWCKRLEADPDSIQDKPKSEAPVHRLAKVQAVRDCLESDRRTSISEVSRTVNLSYGSTQKVITKDLGLRKKPARWVPHFLSQANKDRRVQLSRNSLALLQCRRDPVQRIVAADESWICAYDPESKEAARQWMDPDQPKPTKVRLDRFSVKIMLVAFIDREGVVHQEFVPNGMGIDRHMYLAILARFREAVRRKRPHLWHNPDSWRLLHDGAPTHIARDVVQFLQYHSLEVMPHPGYSPDLNPLDYWFFSKVKSTLKGQRFRNVQDLQTACEQAIRAIPAQDFAAAMDRYLDRLRQCIAASGEYFDEHAH